MRPLIDDLWQATRRLGQRPALTLVACATLALGLGANIAIYTLVCAVSSQPLPVSAPSELYRLGDDDNCCVNSGMQSRYSLFSYPLYSHLRDQIQEFTSLASFQASLQDMSVRPEGGSVSLSASSDYVSGNYFDTLGVAPALGRLLKADDDDPARPAVFVMSYRVWRDQFGADPALIGQTFVVGGTGMTLVGVSEERFFGETRRPEPPGLFLPLGIERQVRGASSMIDREAQDWLRIIGRLPDGGRVEATQAQADAALRQWLGDHLATTEEERAALPATTTPIVSASAGVETLRMVFEQPLTILFVMSGLVLLIAAANLANLMIAHTDRVQTAIRVALGAPRARLVRQALVEVTVLSLTGAAVGIVVASMATRSILALVFPDAVGLPVDVTPSAAVLRLPQDLRW
jgi:predicted permease